jgi:hypothetical protein
MAIAGIPVKQPGLSIGRAKVRRIYLGIDVAVDRQ